MKIYRLIMAGMAVAVAEPASAAVSSVRGSYLRTYGPSPLRFASSPAAVDASAQVAFVLPPLARGDEVDQPPAPRHLPLPGSALANPSLAGGAPPTGSPTDPDSVYGPEPPPTISSDPTPSIPVSLDPNDTPPAGPGLHGAPVSPGMLMPFFSQPQGDGARVVVPLQFSPAPPPPIRSSRATYTKQ